MCAQDIPVHTQLQGTFLVVRRPNHSFQNPFPLDTASQRDALGHNGNNSSQAGVLEDPAWSNTGLTQLSLNVQLDLKALWDHAHQAPEEQFVAQQLCMPLTRADLMKYYSEGCIAKNVLHQNY